MSIFDFLKKGVNMPVAKKKVVKVAKAPKVVPGSKTFNKRADEINKALNEI